VQFSSANGSRPRRRVRRVSPADLLHPSALRHPGGAILELHAHSWERSADSGVSADAIVAQAVARGLDGVCLTEHNALWSEEGVRALAERHGITVLRGMELGTDAGHVLVFGLDHYSPELLFMETLRPIVEAEGAVMILAHPMRALSSGTHPSWDRFPALFEAIEVLNGDHSNFGDGYYQRLAAEMGLAAVAGSDVHSRPAVGRVGTAFSEPVPDVDTLVRLIRARAVAPVDMRPHGGADSQAHGSH
jgi:predicted metal-dependent phosphoesterase TrpH